MALTLTRSALRCATVHRLLGRYVDGDLTAHETEQMSCHVAVCRECAEALTGMVRAEGTLTGAVPSVMPLSTEARNEIFVQALTRSGVLNRRPLQRRVTTWCLAAGVVVTAGWIGRPRLEAPRPGEAQLPMLPSISAMPFLSQLQRTDEEGRSSRHPQPHAAKGRARSRKSGPQFASAGPVEGRATAEAVGQGSLVLVVTSTSEGDTETSPQAQPGGAGYARASGEFRDAQGRTVWIRATAETPEMPADTVRIVSTCGPLDVQPEPEPEFSAPPIPGPDPTSPAPLTLGDTELQTTQAEGLSPLKDLTP